VPGRRRRCDQSSILRSSPIRIRDVRATWLRCPIPEASQHVSDFGRIATFDTALIEVELDDGQIGYGEARPAVGSAGAASAIVAVVEHELRPLLVGTDPRRIAAAWETMYSGSRAGFALAAGRAFPVLSRRGMTVCAISGVDIALWDLRGKALGVPVSDLLGGRCHDRMPAYASGGWADAGAIGAQLQGYVDRGGFTAVKMRVGVMDGTVATSIARVRAAREGLGPGVGIMVDAHGTFLPREAIRFARGVEDCDLTWFEEPVNADDRRGAAEVRAATGIPIAAGESEFTRFDFRDLIEARAVDILQPDLGICGGISEAQRIVALASTHGLTVAPHIWGGAFVFAAGVHLAAASPAATILEFSLGANPMLHDMVEESFTIENGTLEIPDRPGLGVTIRPEFVEEFRVVHV
jgi:L-alanine-DL-glutamate epimerase-like enolase superfamily enzyme